MSMNEIGGAIRALREQKGLTQAQLAEAIAVSDKAVSKWETGKGLPDIALIEPLAGALGVSVMELLAAAPVVNRNSSGNMTRARFYVCPVCGNVLFALGDAAISCCGVTLPPLEAEPAEADHLPQAEPVEDELFVTVAHAMTKSHYLSFLALVAMDRVQFVKLYPEGNAEARFKLRGHGMLYAYCNRHGLFRMKI